ncbi:Uncharacterised protein [Escherichia coli]|uniref:Uncharacterized protein n=1 Tax=Escherichia coli TaxID=562 RepID=A0A377E1A5_ECOLX|nr:Uncharacterised protein [Escherichia coli]
MSFYERFEQVVALVLSAVIAVIIVVSLFQLISIVFTLLVLDAFNPLDHEVFQKRVRHDHDALDRDGVQAFHRARGRCVGTASSRSRRWS